MRVFLSAILLLLLWSQCYAGETQAPVVHPLTHDDVEAYFDGFFPDALTRADIAGAVVVVVKDGRIVLEKGYGYANMASRQPVDPQKTLFRPGSVSKLFIWTAVMQLVEQHKLDLDGDVNSYLDFRIPAAFGKPITLRHLMTHMAGFEEHLKSIMVYDPRRLQSLRAMLADRTPKRIFPPGEISAYSNYGACLAAYIVQRVSGEDFNHYVAQHIFAPLQMTRATFVQPLSTKHSSDLAQSYILASDPPKPSELYNLGPSGGSYATGEDMAHFMIAHLNGGSYGGASILRPETATLMHQTAFQPAPPLPGMALGFYHEDRNGISIIGHGGDTIYFHSDLHLILDRNVGLFVSLNSAGNDPNLTESLRPFLLDHFLGRYFPAPGPLPAVALRSAPSDARQVAGFYEVSRRSDSNFLSIARFLLPVIVVANSDGSLEFPTFSAVGVIGRWIEIAPFVWRQPHGDYRVAARMENGHVKFLSSDMFPPVLLLLPVSFWRSFAFVLPVVIGSLLILSLAVLLWPIKAILRWRYARPLALGRRDAMLYRGTRIVALLFCVTFGAWFWFVLAGRADLALFDTASDAFIRSLQGLSVIAMIAALIPMMAFLTALRDRQRPWWTKVTDGLIVIASLVLSGFLIDYHFLTLSLNY